MIIASNDMAQLDLRSLVTVAQSRQDMDAISVEIVNDGQTGSLVGALNGIDHSNNLTYDVPLRDSGILRNSTGAYPFRLDGDFTTLVSITNVGDKPSEFVMQMNYEGGPYLFKTRKLAVGETALYDLKKIRDEQQPDWKGKTLPLNLTSGQVRWSIHGGHPARLLGRSQVVSASNRISTSYSCACSCPSGPANIFIAPSSSGTVFINDTFDFFAEEEDTDCNGYITGPYGAGGYWEQSDPSVASMDNSNGGAHMTALAVGETDLTVSGEYEEYEWDGLECLDYGEVIWYLYGGLTVAPTVTLSSISAVGKNYTNTIHVTLNPSPSNVQVTLTLSTTSGTGNAVFNSNNSNTLAINSTSDVVIKGVTGSSTANNIKLTAAAGNKTLATTNFTVLLVQLSLRNSGTVSSDDSGGSEENTVIGKLDLGTIFSTGTARHSWRTAVEIVGTITPNNFTTEVDLTRNIIKSYFYLDTTFVPSISIDSEQSDPTIDPLLNDFDPQSGGSHGKVYDLDAPALYSTDSAPIGVILRVRTNFREYATVQGVRVSDDLKWFSRLSIMKTENGDVLQNDISEDNTSGTGETKLTYNLQ